MRITALVKHPEHVTCRYRIAAFRPHLENAGYRLDICGWPRSWLGRLALYHRLRRADVLIVQRRLLRPWLLRLVRGRVRRLVYDFDDAIFFRNSYDARGPDSAGRSRYFTEMVHLADAVVAGNDFLGARAVAGTDPARVQVIPTCVDVARYPIARHDARDGVAQLVWVGSASTIQALEQLGPVLDGLGKTGAGLQLKVICDRSLELRSLPVRFCPWRETSEGAEIAAADIGISWLPDDPWSRGKCGLKVLQYMAAGLPVVANPVGVQAELVRPGETGYLAETPQEWADAIRRLAAEPELRRAMGRAARRLIEAEYHVRVGAARWLDLLDRLCGARVEAVRVAVPAAAREVVAEPADAPVPVAHRITT
jgi:glycosyltransferase involved in cell wall biosynthesis